MTSETAEFLAALYGEKPEAAWILIWAKKGDRASATKISRWAQDVNEAVAAVNAANSEPGWDTYAGICTGPKRGGKSNRIEMKDTVSMPCLWLDIDIAGAGHTTRKKYPTSEAEARALIAMCPLAPSFVIHSGGGLQPYWLLKEHWTFDTADEREQAQTLIRGWVRMFQIYAATKGLDIDPVFDLARVMRVPGTSNWKETEPRLVRIVDRSDVRYDPTELRGIVPPEAFSEETAKGIVTREAVKTANFTLDPNATPPAEKLIALQLADTKFDATVKYQRTDLKDSTPSAYDMALCNFAAYAEWTEQEIADLLMFVRRTHRQNPKLDNVQYFVRTINEAMAAAQRRRAMEELRGNAAALRIVDRPAEGATGDAEPVERTTERAPRELTLQYLSEALGCRINDVIKYAQDPPKYRLITESGGIDLGDVSGLIEQGSIRKALAATNGHYIPKFKADDWEAIAQMLLDVCKVISTGPEATDAGAMREWLKVYFGENPPAGAATDVTITNQQPHVDGAFICFYAAAFRAWLFQRQQEKVSGKQLGILLRRVKGLPAQVRLGESTRALWKVPRNGRLSNGEAITKSKGSADGTGGNDPATSRPATGVGSET